MTEEIKNYFKTDRTHASGVALVIKHSNRLALKKQINIHPESEYITGVIFEELRELAGITQSDFKDILSVSVKRYVKPDPEISIPKVISVETDMQESSMSDTQPASVKKASRKK